jgi:hypothetical protein
VFSFLSIIAAQTAIVPIFRGLAAVLSIGSAPHSSRSVMCWYIPSRRQKVLHCNSPLLELYRGHRVAVEAVTTTSPTGAAVNPKKLVIEPTARLSGYTEDSQRGVLS